MELSEFTELIMTLFPNCVDFAIHFRTASTLPTSLIPASWDVDMQRNMIELFLNFRTASPMPRSLPIAKREGIRWKLWNFV